MSKRISTAFTVFVTASLLVASCSGSGAGGSGSSGGPTSTATIDFDHTESGYILLTTTGTPFLYSTDDSASSDTNFIAAGDGFSGQVERGFLSFDLTLPPEATEIVSARLYVYPYNFANDPYAELGGQLNAHGVEYGSLSANDYYTVREHGPFKINTSTADEDSWVSADVTLAVADDFADGEARTQIMIRFPIDNNSDTNPHRVFLEGDETSLEAPYLEIEYR